MGAKKRVEPEEQEIEDREPPEPDGEDFRGNQAMEYDREQRIAWQKLK